MDWNTISVPYLPVFPTNGIPRIIWGIMRDIMPVFSIVILPLWDWIYNPKMEPVKDELTSLIQI